MTTLIEHQEVVEERASMVDAIQKRFLGQKSEELILLYRTIGKGAYRQMNFFLAKVGDHLRANGVFENIDE